MYVEAPPSFSKLVDNLGGDGLLEAYEASGEVIDKKRYLHWDTLRRLPPPGALTSEQWWIKVKLTRNGESRQLPLRTVGGAPFVYTTPDAVQRQLHRIDQRVAGELAMEEAVTSDRDARRRYLVNSLEEEAIRSSQLEGAMTSRGVAKELLRSGRGPRDSGERMIFNTYRAMQFMRDEVGGELTPEKVMQVQRIVTEGTLDDPADAGRLQRPGDVRVRVLDREDRPDREPLHIPPPAEELPERMRALCAFANEGDEAEPFVHPVLRAILLHFQLAYDHPFVDGNGRTARILFFWSMRSHGFWLAEYLPISRLLRNSQRAYLRAFLETETDGGDTTYFLVHQLATIERAIDDLGAYIRRKGKERRDAERLLDDVAALNGRQLVLLTHALKHPDHSYTFAGHARSNKVTHETARNDLGALAERGLLVRRRRGRTYVFEPPPNLPERLKESGA